MPPRSIPTAPASPSRTEPMWKLHDVALYYNVSDSTAKRWVLLGKIPALKIGGSIRFDPESVRRAATVR